MVVVSAWRQAPSCSSGMSLGSVVAMGSSQWVVEHLGWQWVFWGAGVVAILWTPFWLYFVRNSPCSHPLMSSQEAELLAPNLVIKPKVSGRAARGGSGRHRARRTHLATPRHL